MISKFARKRRESLIDGEDINFELRLIDGTEDYYAGYDGNIYRKYEDNKFYKIKGHENRQARGYIYVQINKKTHRAHRVIAKAFIPNPDNLPEVDHIDSNKQNNCVENLQWVTRSQNAKKAVDDGLIVNDKGFNDSQSIPVVCFNKDRQLMKIYGSITEAHKELGFSKSTIKRHVDHTSPKIRCNYYFRSLEEYKEKGFVL